MGSYYYKLSKNRILDYTTNGWFKCPVMLKEQKEYEDQGKIYLRDERKHNIVETGKNHVTYREAKREELPNGDIVVINEKIFQKATKERKDLVCKCGATLEFIGYHAYIEKVIKPGETFLGGLTTMGHETKRLNDRWFKTKGAQQKWIKNELAKDRT